MKTLKLGLFALPFIFSTAAFATTDNCGTLIKDVPGTYTLVKRIMPNGTTLSGSNVQGVTIFSPDGYRVTTVAIDAGNTIFSAGAQTKYSFTSTSFSDKLIALTLFEGTGKPILKFNQSKATVPITCSNGKLTIQNPPVDPLSSLTFTKTGMTAILNKGANTGATDVWKKIK